MLARPVVSSPASSAEGLMIQPLTSMYHVTVDGPVAVPSKDHAPRLLSACLTITWESGVWSPAGASAPCHNNFTYWRCSSILLPENTITLKYHTSRNLTVVKMSCALVYKTGSESLWGQTSDVCCSCDLGFSEIIGMVDCMDVFIASPCDGLWQ